MHADVAPIPAESMFGMRSLRRFGWTLAQIAELYDCDVETVAVALENEHHVPGCPHHEGGDHGAA